MFFNKGRIGIIAGAGPEAGLDLFSKILVHNKSNFSNDYLGDVCAPEILLYSIPELGYAIDIVENEEKLWITLEKSLDFLDGKVDIVCIACNVLHYFLSRINIEKYSFEIISVIDIVQEILDKYDSVAMLSIRKVIDFGKHSPFSQLVGKNNIEVPDFNKIDELIKYIKINGVEDGIASLMFNQILTEIKSKYLILACTELPLLPLKKFHRFFIDVSDLLAFRVARASYVMRYS